MLTIVRTHNDPVYVTRKVWEEIKKFQTTPLHQAEIFANKVSCLLEFKCKIGPDLYLRHLAFAPVIEEQNPLNIDRAWRLWQDPNNVLKGIL